MLKTIKKISKKPSFSLFFFSNTELDPKSSDYSKELTRKYHRGVNRQKYNLSPGEKIQGFKLIKKELFTDFSLTAYTFQHESLSTPIIHLDTADTNNCFALIFRTPALNNSGLANLLQHMILCGSKGFPVRDPLAHMEGRSLNDYSQMQPWSGPGYSVYPFCTENVKDFENLMGVCLDATLNPVLDRMDFLNEGWRYEFASQEERKGLSISGECYSQMKSYWQIPENIFLESIKSNIFQSHEHMFSNGGTPSEITKSTYRDIVDYWEKFYHPRNMRIFSYGDMDLTKNIEFIEEFLKKHSLIERPFSLVKDFYVPCKKRDEILNVSVKCPPNPEGGPQVQFSLGFLCGDLMKEPSIAVEMNVLSYVLFETPYSPLLRELLLTGKALGFCTGYGFDDSTREGTFTIGVKGITENQVEEIEELILRTLSKINKTGFEKGLVELSINQIELNSKLMRYDFGLNLLNNFVGVYGNCALEDVGLINMEFLKGSENFARILERLKKGERILEGLVKKFLIENDHKVRIVMKPDNDLLKDLYENEKRSLKNQEASMSQEEKERIFLDNEKLEKHRQAIQDLSCLPILELNEIPLEIEKSEFLEEDFNGNKQTSFLNEIMKGFFNRDEGDVCWKPAYEWDDIFKNKN